MPLEDGAQVQPLTIGRAGPASTDVGDVSWVVPTVQVYTATWVPGTARTPGRRRRPAGRASGTKG